MNVFEQVENAHLSLLLAIGWKADIALILGTGLGDLVSAIEVERRIAYSDIQGFPVSTVTTHAGELVLGRWQGKSVAVFSGRFHLYEGYSAKQVALPVYLAKRLGADCLVVTNCSGGLNAEFKPGDVMLITDHLNQLGANPLIGPNDDRLGLRFPDMSDAYCRSRQQAVRAAAESIQINLREGVYVAVPGPSLETNAERRYLASLGADAVGMSTVIEVIAANHAGMAVAGLSAISNTATGGPDQQPDTLESILANVHLASNKMKALLAAVVTQL